MMAPETLVDADAVAQLLTPDLATLLYLSKGALYALPAEGGEPVSLIDAGDDSGRIDATFPSSGSSFAYTVGGAVYRIELAESLAIDISGATAVPGTVAYDGVGTAILFLDQAGDLLRVPQGELSPSRAATGVTGFWPVAKSSEILAITEGKLRLLAVGAQ
jgi:hypothetical protein